MRLILTCWLLLVTGTLFGLPSQAVPDARLLSELPHLNFRHYSFEQGLSQASVYAFTQDKHGFIWMATQDGLNRFDGREFTVYRQQDDVNSPISNDIRALYTDNSGDIWIGTYGGGLSVFDYDRQAFINFAELMPDHHIASATIVDIKQGPTGMMWLATTDGFFIVDPSSRAIEHHRVVNSKTPTTDNHIRDFAFLDNDTTILATANGLKRFERKTDAILPLSTHPIVNSTEVNSVLLQDKQTLWFAGKQEGIYRYQFADDSLTPYLLNENPRLPLANIKNMVLDGQILWAVSRQFGLFKLDISTGQMTHIVHSANDPTGLSTNSLLSIFKDINGLIWIGTWNNGVDMFNQNKIVFYNLLPASRQHTGLSNKNVWSVMRDGQGSYWIGTVRGLNKVTTTPLSFATFNRTARPDALSSDQIWALGQFDNNRLWVGTFDSGLNLFNRETGAVEQYFSKSDKRYTDSGTLDIFQSSSGDWWFAGRLHGLGHFNPKTNNIDFYISENRDVRQGMLIYDIAESKDGRLWLATEGLGLVEFSPSDKQFAHHLAQANKKNSLLSNSVLSVEVADNGDLLIATDKGFSIRHPDGQYTNYTGQQGLRNSFINSATQGCDGAYWLATNQGISRIDPKRSTVTNFGKADGILNQEFNADVVFNDAQTCEILFGGSNGVTAFQPKVPHTPKSLTLKVSQLLKYYKPLSLSQDLNQLRELSFSHQDKVISIKLALMNFANVGQHNYRYRFLSDDAQWIELGTQNQIDLYNLDFGSHQLELQGFDASTGVYSNIRILTLNVEPPAWLSSWALSVYALLILLTLLYIFKMQNDKVKLHRAIADNERQVNEHLKELDRLKDEFLANTSHELRTPLNAIIGLSELMTESDLTDYSSQEIKDHFKVIQISGNHLLALVSDILDYSAISENKIRMNFQTVELEKMVQSLIYELQILNNEKSIDISYQIEGPKARLEADPRRLYQILLNLLTNAIKFTERGTVQLLIQQNSHNMQIQIIDTGIGIPQDKLGTIFNRFEQVDGSNQRRFGGTGLGLAITKQLVEQHHGNIKVETIEGKGTTFTVTLPLKQPTHSA